jgi:hypothetical protein
MRHLILPRRPTLVNSTSWDFPVCGPALIITFWFHQLRGVSKPAHSLRLIRLIFGGQASPAPRLLPFHFQENLRRFYHRDRVGRLYKASPEQPTSRTVQASSRTSSNLQAPRPPAPLGLDSPLDIVWLLFWLHRQHDALSVV